MQGHLGQHFAQCSTVGIGLQPFACRFFSMQFSHATHFHHHMVSVVAHSSTCQPSSHCHQHQHHLTQHSSTHTHQLLPHPSFAGGITWGITHISLSHHHQGQLITPQQGPTPAASNIMLSPTCTIWRITPRAASSSQFISSCPMHCQQSAHCPLFGPVAHQFGSQHPISCWLILVRPFPVGPAGPFSQQPSSNSHSAIAPQAPDLWSNFHRCLGGALFSQPGANAVSPLSSDARAGLSD